jgi:hypothetical protein
MLICLIALILLALLPVVVAVYPAAPLPAVVTAGMVVATPRCRSMRPDFDVATRFGGDTARNDLAEGEGRRRDAEGAGCGDGGSVMPARVAAAMPDLRAVRIAEAAGVDPLTVAQVP